MWEQPHFDAVRFQLVLLRTSEPKSSVAKAIGQPGSAPIRFAVSSKDSGVVTLAFFEAGVAAAGGGCFPVTGYSNQEKSPSRFGRLAVEPWWESSANALPHARNITATTATPHSTLAARAPPPLGVRCTQPVVTLGRKLIGWRMLTFILPDGKSLCVVVVVPFTRREPVAQTLPAVSIDRSGQKVFLMPLVRRPTLNQLAAGKLFRLGR